MIPTTRVSETSRINFTQRRRNSPKLQIHLNDHHESIPQYIEFFFQNPVKQKPYLFLKMPLSE